VLRFALELSDLIQLKGIIASCSISSLKTLINLLAPAIMNGTPVPALKYYTGRMLVPIIPRLLVPTGLFLSNISRKREVVENFRKDPLRVPNISLQTGKDYWK